MAQAFMAGRGAAQWQLLWENASPSSNFPAQTVSFDATGLDAIAICCMPSAGDKGSDVKIIKIGRTHEEEQTVGWFLVVNTEFNDTFCVQRRAAVLPGSIAFQAASRQTFGTSGMWTVANQYFVPVQIWGTKLFKEVP